MNSKFYYYIYKKSEMMQWIHDYQLILFDFDGLLVNTEEIHYMAYQRMCSRRGISMDMTFGEYCQIAHYRSEGLREQLYARYPQLYIQEPSWPVLYAEKKQAVIELLNGGKVQLMPGVERLLRALQAASIRRCVVTHSSFELISAVLKQHPIFDTISHWITRELYSKPKPDPECYLTAIRQLSKPDDAVVGFEDTPRGLKALLGAGAKAVLICETQYPEIPAFIQLGASHYKSFADIPDRGPLILQDSPLS